MNKNVVYASSLALSLVALAAVVPQAKPPKEVPVQVAPEGKQGMSHTHMKMAREPHHLLCMAYRQNLVAFTKTLHDQTGHGRTFHLECARTAVSEMRRSFDQMNLHHDEHMKTLPTDMHSGMHKMLKQMEHHKAGLDTELTALEQEVKEASPDVKKLARLAGNVHSHCAGMSTMHAEKPAIKKEKKDG